MEYNIQEFIKKYINKYCFFANQSLYDPETKLYSEIHTVNILIDNDQNIYDYCKEFFSEDNMVILNETKITQNLKPPNIVLDKHNEYYIIHEVINNNPKFICIGKLIL